MADDISLYQEGIKGCVPFFGKEACLPVGRGKGRFYQDVLRTQY
jgi:hypothetical protein